MALLRSSSKSLPDVSDPLVAGDPAVSVDAAVTSQGPAPVGATQRPILGFLAPFPTDRRLRRVSQLLVGLVLYGFTMGLMVRAVFGLDPWDVFHQGLTKLLGHWVDLSYGTVITGVSVLVLLAWIPLRQRPGVGTVANAAIIGWTTDGTLALIHPVSGIGWRIAILVAAVVGNALAGALYLGAGMGPGPRDGLMTGLVAKGVGSVRVVRTGIEVSVLLIGWACGGLVGIGTVIYALGIGPLLQVLLPRLSVSPMVVAPRRLRPGRRRIRSRAH